MKRERVVVTVLGQDRVGIVAGISSVLAKEKANIIDMRSAQMRDLFVMIMLVDITDVKSPMDKFRERLIKKGEQLSVQVLVQHEDLFRFMHRV